MSRTRWSSSASSVSGRSRRDLLLEPKRDHAMHGGKERARQAGAIVGLSMRQQRGQRSLKTREKLVARVGIPVRHRRAAGKPMLEERAPTGFVAPREVEIGAGERLQRAGGRRGGQRRVERLAEPLQGRKIHPQDQFVEIVEGGIDRPQRTTGFPKRDRAPSAPRGPGPRSTDARRRADAHAVSSDAARRPPSWSRSPHHPQRRALEAPSAPIAGLTVVHSTNREGATRVP